MLKIIISKSEEYVNDSRLCSLMTILFCLEGALVYLG